MDTKDWLPAGFGFVAGILGSLVLMRKEDRAIQIKEITEERRLWRENIRKLTISIVTVFSKPENSSGDKVAEYRCQLVTALNPKDMHDNDILMCFDTLSTQNPETIKVFSNRIALLLKHDWERVKWESMPFYWRGWFRLTQILCLFLYRPKDLQWKRKDFRVLPKNISVQV